MLTCFLLLILWDRVYSGDLQYTAIKFSRRLDTCDVEDLPILLSTTKVVYAFSDVNPGDEGGQPTFHQEYGVKSVRFMNPDDGNLPPLPDGAEFFEVVHDEIYVDFNRTVEAPGTMYWCSGHFLPPSPERQVVRIEPILDPDHESILHHIEVLFLFVYSLLALCL